jgi:hypothetical protein
VCAFCSSFRNGAWWSSGWCSHNKLKPLGLRTLAGVLTPDDNNGDAPTRPHNTTLTELRLAHNWGCGLTSWGAGRHDVSGVMALLAAVWHGSKLAALDVGYNRLGAAGVQSVVAAAEAAALVGLHARSAYRLLCFMFRSRVLASRRSVVAARAVRLLGDVATPKQQ